MGRIERLKELIPKLKAIKRIHPLKKESLEWELKILGKREKAINCRWCYKPFEGTT